MTESRAHLLDRKRDLLEALRTLERDHVEGSVDEDAYHSARRRYELQAAAILERLDEMPSDNSSEVARAATFAVGGTRSRRLPIVVTLTLVSVALIVLLASALRQRGNGQSITGEQPGVAATPAAQQPPALVVAQQNARAHPRSVDAQLRLGNAYLDAGDSARADQTYEAAARLDPRRPEAPTLHALVLASARRYDTALTVLRAVERSHPKYARAWLADGLVASRRRSGYPRAIQAWRRFLALQPSGPVAVEIRASLAGLISVQSGAK